MGHVTEVNFNDMYCKCGNKIIDHEDSAMCVCCGNTTCSDKCHREHITKNDLCYFRYNFTIESDI